MVITVHGGAYASTQKAGWEVFRPCEMKSNDTERFLLFSSLCFILGLHWCVGPEPREIQAPVGKSHQSAWGWTPPPPPPPGPPLAVGVGSGALCSPKASLSLLQSQFLALIKRLVSGSKTHSCPMGLAFISAPIPSFPQRLP